MSREEGKVSFFRQYLFTSYNRLRFVVSAIFAILIFVLDLINVGRFDQFGSYCSAFGISAFFQLLLAGLAFVGNQGAFDIFGFYPSRKRVNGKKENYREFVERKNKDRELTKFGFMPYIFVGLILLFFSLIFFLLVKLF